jgi:hypothetical protein
VCIGDGDTYKYIPSCHFYHDQYIVGQGIQVKMNASRLLRKKKKKYTIKTKTQVADNNGSGR